MDGIIELMYTMTVRLNFCRVLDIKKMLPRGFLLICFRKKYVKNCRIRHSYGDDDEEDPCIEEEAVLLTETAIADGTARPPPTLQSVAAPEGANLEFGGKACKWCGSRTHMRKSHKDCPFNKNV